MREWKPTDARVPMTMSGMVVLAHDLDEDHPARREAFRTFISWDDTGDMVWVPQEVLNTVGAIVSYAMEERRRRRKEERDGGEA